MNWDFYLTVKVGGIAVFVFAAGIAASKGLALTRPKTFFINASAVFAGYLLSTSWYIVQHVLGGEPYQFRNIFHAWDNAGAVLYGWLIGGTLALIILTRMFKIDTIRYLDTVFPWMLVAQFLNRLGCFDAGCCYGKQFSRELLMRYAPLVRQAMAALGRHPVQLYECLFDLLLLAAILLFAKKKGHATMMYFIGYPIGRFFLEFLRGDNQPALWFMTVPQVTSICILALALLLKNKILICTKQN